MVLQVGCKQIAGGAPQQRRTRRQGRVVNRIAMVLGSDVALPSDGVDHRLVVASVAKGELHGLCACSEGQELVPQADSKDRPHCVALKCQHFLELFHRVFAHGGVARSVGEEEAVVVGQVLAELVIPRHHGNLWHVKRNTKWSKEENNDDTRIDGKRTSSGCSTAQRQRPAPKDQTPPLLRGLTSAPRFTSSRMMLFFIPQSTARTRVGFPLPNTRTSGTETSATRFFSPISVNGSEVEPSKSMRPFMDPFARIFFVRRRVSSPVRPGTPCKDQTSHFNWRILVCHNEEVFKKNSSVKNLGWRHGQRAPRATNLPPRSSANRRGTGGRSSESSHGHSLGREPLLHECDCSQTHGEDRTHRCGKGRARRSFPPWAWSW